MPTPSVFRAIFTGLLLLILNQAFASSSEPAPKDKLNGVRAQIAANNWAGAIDELKHVNDTTSAEWNNLMGFSLRKAQNPDLDASQKYYDIALSIDPKHRGTLEYSGELYLIKGDLAMAEQRLATLDKVCLLPCAEYTELKNSIARYKQAGNKVVPSQY